MNRTGQNSGCTAHDISLDTAVCSGTYKRDNKIKKRSSKNYKANKTLK